MFAGSSDGRRSPSLAAVMVASALLTFCGAARASFHLWQISEIYSNASGTVQFVELSSAFPGQNFLTGHFISTTGATTQTFTFMADLPFDTTNRHFLVATQGFANLGVVTPDYIVPNGFIPAAGNVNFASVDMVNYAALPTDNIRSIDRFGTPAVNSPTNEAGVSASVQPPAAPQLLGLQPGIGQIAVSISPPNGVPAGLMPTSYTATCNPGAISVTSPTPAVLVTGLAGGTNYSCTATATNPVGTGPASTPLNATTFSAPDAPLIGAATPGDGLAGVYFSPPGFNGGAAIGSYTATCNPGAVSAQGLTSPVIVSGLVDGTAYSCSVTASNIVGTGPPSATVAVTPSAAAALQLLAVQSRKSHGAAGAFDVNIDPAPLINGAISVEPRGIGAGHTIVFQFTVPVTSIGAVASVDAANNAAGAANGAFAGNEVLVTLRGIPDNQRVTVSVGNVNNAGVDFSASLGFLVGDVNASRSVSASDIVAIKAHGGQGVGAANFRFDPGLNGSIGAGDVSAAKARAGTVLR